MVSLISILAGISTSLVRMWLPLARADAAMRQVSFTLTSAREQAVSETRNIELEIDNDQMQLFRDEPGTDDRTLLLTRPLEHDMRFTLFSPVPDTPDRFGRAAAVDFGRALLLRFTSDGSLIDEQGVPVNGTVFIGLPGNEQTARAVTVMGGTGRVQAYKWTGAQWDR